MESAFCSRYRKFTEYISRETSEKGSNQKEHAFNSIWSVSPNNLEFFKNCKLNPKKTKFDSKDSEECSTIYFELKNTHHPQIPHLKCNVFIYKLGLFRLQIDDTGTGLSDYKRYKVGKEVIFKDNLVKKYLVSKESSDVNIDESENRITITLVNENDECKYTFVMYFKPFKIETFLCDKKIATVNGNQFFNFERSGRTYRRNNNLNAKFTQKSYKISIKDLVQEKNQRNVIFKWLKSHYNAIRDIIKLFNYNKTISEIVDSVDIYPKGIWSELFNNFIDFNQNGPIAIGTDIQIHSCNDTYGLAEKTASLNLQDFDEPYRFYNVDNFKYELNSTDPLYGSSPNLISLSDFYFENKKKVIFSNILWLNPSDTYVKLNKIRNDHSEKYLDTWWVSETGVLDLVIMVSTRLEQLYYNLGIITGFPYFAPRFSLGYHYSKWEHTSEERVYNIQNLLKKNDIPYDSIWLDIEHTFNKQYFTWNKTAFPNMNEMIKNLDKDNKYLVVISDPHISINKSYSMYSSFEKLKYCGKGFYKISVNYKKMLKYLFITKIIPKIHLRINCKIELIIHKDNISNSKLVAKTINSPWVKIPNYNNEINDFVGKCWPGSSKYLNFFSNEVGNYYSRYFEKMYKMHKNLGYWLDMNEPSVFELPELSFPKQVEFGNDGLDNRKVHSLYSFNHARYAFNGLVRKFQGQRRPFLLTRSFWIGSHRYSNIWTGDTESNWNYYYYTIITNLRNAICGFSLTGSDVGGYESFNDDVYLLIRWYQLGIWFPFYRSHSSINTLSRDYIFSYPIIKKYIKLRYSLIPYWYTLLAKYSFYSIPMIKPLFWLNPTDYNLRSIDNSFLVGDSFMIKSIEKGLHSLLILHYYLCNFNYANKILNHNKDYLYKIWYSVYGKTIYIDTKEQYYYNNNINNTPDFVKGGSIIPFSSESSLLSSKEQLKYPIKLVIYLTGELLNSNKLKNQILFPEMKYYNYTNENYYNDYMIDILTLHSEGSIYLDDGETYSYLNNEYIFDDIIFTLSCNNYVFNNTNEDLGYTPNIIDNVLEKNLLKSTFNEKYQRDKLRLFKENFGYEIYIKQRNDKLMYKMNNNNDNYYNHHILSLLEEDIGDLIINNNNNNNNNNNIQDKNVNKYNKQISLIQINGLIIKPKKILLVKRKNNNSLVFQRLKYKLIKSKYFGNNHLIKGNLYSIEINLDNNDVNFGNYNWRIKIIL
ncbi:secreted alpha glucosidase-like family protein [Cryptosporidium ubiquitum]|uniref:Secreted alpha glucosidase-like family protein n=1 Tax=Cryptosporidium ubiquitum TaxID=857276 RepID=A0A1J4MH31_9CRYT|nr:secreted alpha glucosidase-like family protein [Cryptosporidium ubiquitum]OII73570.1 secreted alpha glucosidase-like family protein [Cryptosporidium ubiquitum]